MKSRKELKVSGMRLTEALFGIPSDINVYPEITSGFLEKDEYGIDAFRRYVRELSY